MVGSDIDNFECPRCSAHDRERHLLLYLQESGLLGHVPDFRILHFAPEGCLTQKLAALAPLEYVKCDLYPTNKDIQRVDIEAMPFSDGSFDMVIANHVLEHVDDDRMALQEIRRVLCLDGVAILQTPYSASLKKTWSDSGIVTGEARLQAYGQEDHVRLFGQDIFERFAASGLRPCLETHAGLLAKYDPAVFGVNEAEPFFLFRRVDNSY
jgi:SAM-dependent methyltransferase